MECANTDVQIPTQSRSVDRAPRHLLARVVEYFVPTPPARRAGDRWLVRLYPTLARRWGTLAAAGWALLPVVWPVHALVLLLATAASLSSVMTAALLVSAGFRR